MTQRWWSPKGAHIGPDEFDLELLQPVQDVRQDLGAALLALHRVGAAACEAVAEEPIPDRYVLVEKIALARQAFAPPLVESVSKSVGQGPYAGLLVRDVIDEAEQGALDVFDACVSRGVPGSVAAVRAGMVFGAPPADLGAYKALACDLRAHPAALQDAADRALFTAVEKIATEEVENLDLPMEEVSKAPAQERDWHGKDPGERSGLSGQFVRTRSEPVLPQSIREQIAAGVPVEEPVDDTKARREARRQAREARQERSERREKRETRQEVQERTDRPREQVARERTGRTRPERARTERAKRSRIRAPRVKRTREQEQEIVTQAVRDRPEVQWTGNDYTQRIEVPAGFTEDLEPLDEQVGMTMSMQEWTNLLSKMRLGKDGFYTFRMGYLAEELDANFLDSEDHHSTVKRVIERGYEHVENNDKREIVKPIHAEITDAEYAQHSPHDLPFVVQARKEEAAEAYLRELGMDENTPTWNQAVQEISSAMVSSRAVENDRDYFVYTPRASAQSVTPRVTAVEFDIDGATGRDDGHGKHTNYTFDPNQLFSIKGSYDEKNDRWTGQPDMHYDPKTGGWRLRFYVMPASWEDQYGIEKAWDESEVVRDRLGQFAPEGMKGATKEQTDLHRLLEQARAAEEEKTVDRSSRREKRVARQDRSERREKRRERLEPVIEARPLTPRLKSERTRRTRTRPERIKVLRDHVEREHLRRRKEKSKDLTRWMPELRQDRRYAVMNVDELTTLLGKDYTGGLIQDWDTRMMLTSGTVDGKAADTIARTVVETDILQQQYGMQAVPLITKDGRRLVLTGDNPSEDAARIQDYMDTLFVENPSVQMIAAEYNHDDSMMFYGNKVPANPVVFVELQEDIDPGKPLQIVPLGSRRLDEFVPDWETPGDAQYQEMIRRALHEEEDSEWGEEDILHNALLPAKEVRPRIEHYRLINVEPAEKPQPWVRRHGTAGTPPHYRPGSGQDT